MTKMTPEVARLLREPFPKSSIGRLPKGGTFLDYVGHGATTDRLLAVDPEWSWEPLALDERGLPAFDAAGGLWIRLTVAGVTRLGYGDAAGKKGPNAVKEAIGDAIRNAAMRFGVALDLWAKEDLVEFQHVEWLRQKAANDSGSAAPADTPPTAQAVAPLSEPARAAEPDTIPEEPPAKVTRSTVADPGPWATDSGAVVTGEGPAAPEHDPATIPGGWASESQMRALNAKAKAVGAKSTADRNALVSHLAGRPVSSLRDLTMAEASKVLDALKWLEKDEALADKTWREIAGGEAS